MPKNEKPLSVAEVYELQPGGEDNPTWINPGMIAVVRSMERKIGKNNKPRWAVVFADQTGSATVESAFFSAPRFAEGDLVQLEGGLRRTEYNGKAQVSIGKNSTVNVVGKSAHHAEQAERAATGAPAVNGAPQMIDGQAVGMALKESIALTVMAWGGIEDLKKLNDPLFWSDVKTHASNIIRIGNSLKRGNLSPSPWQAAEAPAPAPQHHSAPPPQNTPRRTAPTNEREAANLGDDNLDEDYPF